MGRSYWACGAQTRLQVSPSQTMACECLQDFTERKGLLSTIGPIVQGPNVVQCPPAVTCPLLQGHVVAAAAGDMPAIATMAAASIAVRMRICRSPFALLDEGRGAGAMKMPPSLRQCYAESAKRHVNWITGRAAAATRLRNGATLVTPARVVCDAKTGPHGQRRARAVQTSMSDTGAGVHSRQEDREP